MTLTIEAISKPDVDTAKGWGDVYTALGKASLVTSKPLAAIGRLAWAAHCLDDLGFDRSELDDLIVQLDGAVDIAIKVENTIKGILGRAQNRWPRANSDIAA